MFHVLLFAWNTSGWNLLGQYRLYLNNPIANFLLYISCFKLHLQSCIISSFRTVPTTHDIIKQSYHYETTLVRCVYFQTSYKTVKLAHCTRNANNLLSNCFYSKRYLSTYHTCFNMYQLASNWTNFSLRPFVSTSVASTYLFNAISLFRSFPN